MSSQLNLRYEKEKYRNFFGRNIDQMAVLLASGRVPMSTNQLMERRLEVRNPKFGEDYKDQIIESVSDAIWTNCVDTGDGVLYHPDGRIRVVTDAEFLRRLTPQSRLSSGAVVLDDGAWNNAKDAPTFTRDQVQRDRFGTVWLALAQDDKALLREYRDAVTAELKARHNYNGENMGVWLANAKYVTTGRLWCVDRSFSYSDALGYDLDDDVGRFVGVVPEAQRASFTSEELLDLTKDLIPEERKQELRERLTRVYTSSK